MGKLLTVVVPAYNAEHYLDQCLSSFITAEPNVMERMEVIVVNDGSTDDTRRIASNYAERYPVTFSVLNKENGGHGSGINAAVQIATGCYFRVVDADDWVITENLPEYLHILETCEADVVVNAFDHVDMKTRRKNPVYPPQELCGRVLSMEKVMKNFKIVRNCFTIHGITYKLKKYVESGTVLSEHVFYEDNEFTTLPFFKMEYLFLSETTIYQYLVGNAEQSVSSINQLKRLPQLEQVFWRVCAIWKELSTGWLKLYLQEKLALMVTAYETVCLLLEPERGRGRKNTATFRDKLAREAEPVYARTETQHRRLFLLHRLHVSGVLMEKVLESAPYRILRNLLRK